jgi:glycosyltransferase involved in cell wall biosynthesis
MNFPITAIILTYNEQDRLPVCLESLKGLPLHIFAVDSFSTDGTLDILRSNNITFAQHPFQHYSNQRNWAQTNCPFQTDWVLHLDAGEWLTEDFRYWLSTSFDPQRPLSGYLCNRQTWFWGKQIRYGGHHPNYHLRLFRKDAGKCENKVYDQHFIAAGPLETLPQHIAIADEVAGNLLDFTRSHARWALMEAIEQVSGEVRGEVKMNRTGNPIEQRRWQKNRIFQRLPLFVRAIAYFLYRYLLRGGFRDGMPGLVFHCLQGLWFRFLIDAYILEIRHGMHKTGLTLSDHILQNYGAQFLITDSL